MALFCRNLCSNARLLQNKMIVQHSLGFINNSVHSAPKPIVKSRFKTALKLSLAGITVGALTGTGYSIYQMNKPYVHIMNEQTFIPVFENLPRITPTREMVYKNDKSGLKLTLYQYQTCPFCCKVRAFLDFYGISYNVVEVDPVLRQAIKWSPYKKVPILVADIGDGAQQPLRDSAMIVSAIASYLKERSNLKDIVNCYPTINYMEEDGTQRNEIMNRYYLMLNNPVKDSTEITEERKWRKWVDDVLVHTLSPNVYRTRDEAFETFYWFSEAGEWEKNFPSWERNLIIYVGATAMWMIGKRLKKKYNLKDDVRQSLYDDCNYWTKAVRAKGTPFMGGNQPNLADLSVYGVLCSIEGAGAFKDLLKNSGISSWYFAMKEAVNNHSGASLLQ